MSVTSELCAAIRERCEGKPPRQYAIIRTDWRLEIAQHGGNGLNLYHTSQPETMVEVGTTGRDREGYRWFLRPGWRDQVKTLVNELGLEMELVEEEILW